MRKSTLLLLLLCVAGALAWTGCSGGGSTAQFTLHTELHPPTGTFVDDPSVYTDGFCADCQLYYGGSCNIGNLAASIPLAKTDQHGLRTVTNVCVPANWNLARYQSSSCPTPVLNFSALVNNSVTVPLPCNGQPVFSATPDTIGVQSPPSTLTFSGDPVASSTYGLPRIDFYDQNGSGIGSVTAASVAADGSSVTVTTPGFLPAQYSTGNYAAIINNKNANGTFSAVAAAGMFIYGNDGVKVVRVGIIGPAAPYACNTVQYQAIATLSDGSLHEVTSDAAWTSSDESAGYLSGNPGQLILPCGSGGFTMLSATYWGYTGTLDVWIGSI